MKHPPPPTIAVATVAVAALALSAFGLVVLFTAPVARLHTGSDNPHTLEPASSGWVVNETFAEQSSVVFHWELYGFAPAASVSVLDSLGNPIYGQSAVLNGSAGGSGSFVSAAGTDRFEFSGLTTGVAEASLAVQFAYLTESPLL